MEEYLRLDLLSSASCVLLEGGGEWRKGANQVLLLIQTNKILRNCLFWGDNWKEEVVEQVRGT